MKTIQELKLLQVWSDMEEGKTDKYFRIESIGETHVECIGLQTKKKLKVRKNRLKPGSARYYLAMDNDIIQEVSRLLEPLKEHQAAASTATEQKPETKLEPVQEAAVQPKTESKPKKKSKPAKAEPTTTA